MKLLRLLFRENRLPLLGVLLLSLCSALLSVGVIAFVNLRLIAGGEAMGSALLQFAGLLILLLACASAGQMALHTLGHRFVYRLRRNLVKRVLDTDIERLEQIGGARILASLSSDIRNITIAFVYLPELVYGLILSLAAFAYLAWLSPSLFGVTLAWMGFTLSVGWLFVGRVNHHIRLLREAEDRLYQDYQAVIDGRKELALNRDRARLLFSEEFDSNARTYRDNVTRADIFNGLAGNWANCMVLGTIGLVFFCANGLGWAAAPVAATFALTVLFLRAPMVASVAAIPSLLAARVALGKLDAMMAPEPTASERTRAYIFGFATLSIGIVLAGLLGGLWLALSIIRSITQPLAQVQKVVGDIEKTGNFSLRIDVQQSDEVGRTAKAINRMIDSQQSAVSEVNLVVTALAAGNFAPRIQADLKGDLANMKDAVNNSADAIQGTTRSLMDLMMALENGHFSQRFNSDAQGEYQAAMTQAANAMHTLDNMLGDVTSVLQQVAKGNLTRRVQAQGNGELAQLKDNINQSLESLSRAMRAINSNTQQVAAAANQTSQAIGSKANTKPTGLAARWPSHRLMCEPAGREPAGRPGARMDAIRRTCADPCPRRAAPPAVRSR